MASKNEGETQQQGQYMNVPIPKKKKKKKPTKITVAGVQNENTNTANHPKNSASPRGQTKKKKKSPKGSTLKNQNGQPKNKPIGQAKTQSQNSTPISQNGQSNNNQKSKGEQTKAAFQGVQNGQSNNKNNKGQNINSNSNNDSKGPNSNSHNVVLGKIPPGADADAIRRVLANPDRFPQKVRSALGNASLELDNKGKFVIRSHGDFGRGRNYCDLRRMIVEKNALPGWLEWLKGRRGWTIDTGKSPYVDYLRDIHEAYVAAIKALMKETETETKSRLEVLYYKTDPVPSESGGPRNGTRKNTQTLWKIASKQDSLQDAVGKIRPFLEVLRYFNDDPEEKWTCLPWLHPTISESTSRHRLYRVRSEISTLMRNSEWGPDAPVQWAAHPSKSQYPRSTITGKLMTELVIGLTNILNYLFLCHPVTVRTLNEVKICLAKLRALGTNGSTAKKPKGPTRKNTTPQNDSSLDPLVIDLTGLSIKD